MQVWDVLTENNLQLQIVKHVSTIVLFQESH